MKRLLNRENGAAQQARAAKASGTGLLPVIREL